MEFDWKKSIGAIAPSLASAFGSPLAGAAVGALLNAFGINSTAPDAESQLAAKVQNATAEDLLKIKQAENDFVVKMKELDIDLDKAIIADVGSARIRDAEIIKALGKRNWRPDVMFVMATTVIVGLVWLIWKDQTITEFVKGIFTLVLGRFLGYLDNIYNFEFGSTRSSKVKDGTISKLSGN
jgi:hypothetical protein